jgi:hypothetical protein
LALEKDAPMERVMRHDKPLPTFLDYIFEANMIDGTIRMIGSILGFSLVLGTLFWLLD